MTAWFLLGVFFSVFSYRYQFTQSVSADILPAFIGLLILWYVGSKLEKNGGWFKEASVSASVLAFLNFIGYASEFKDLLPKATTFADSDIFRFILTGVNYVYENGALVFSGLTFVVLQFFCRALGSVAEENKKHTVAVIFYVFTWVFLALAVFYTVAAFISLPFGAWIIGYPITAVFAVFAAIFMKKNELD